jgi:hypothetical protein
MRRLQFVFLALTFLFALFLSAATPAAAADNRPVNWVNAAFNMNGDKDSSQSNWVLVKATIKLLEDGSTVGNVQTHNYTGEVMSHTESIDQAATAFWEQGSDRYARFVVTQHQKPTGALFIARFTFRDSGEPGVDDSVLFENYWPGGFLPSPPFPPGIFLPAGWYPFVSQNPIPNGNVQIHIGD